MSRGVDSQGLLVVNADDLGVTKGATLGIVRAHREGIVTSASLAATTEYYQHAVELCTRTCPDLGIGLHFTLTSGKPLSPVREVPALVNERGFLRWRFVRLMVAASASAKSDLLTQIDLELEAQLQRLRADGIRPDHIDGERHVHLIPGIFDLVVAAARRHGVPFVRVGRDIGNRFFSIQDAPGLALRGGFAKSALLSALSVRNRRRLGDGVRSADAVASYLYTGRLDLLLKNLLTASPLSGVVEVMVHPGLPEQSRDVALGNDELERYVGSEDRRRELETCIEARAWIGAWTLTSFGRLGGDRPRA
jgi:predicted glycoside hydrolase/deacetylase ChbG (UPF0249 family)